MKDAKEIISKKKLKDLETVMNLKYGLSRKDRKFYLEVREEGQSLYVTSTLKNEDESFYYPVESFIKIKKNTEKTLLQTALLLLDYIDVYFDEYFKDSENIYLNIDWKEHSFAGEELYLRAQIKNLKCERIADELLSTGAI
jgi:hypothetical protein